MIKRVISMPLAAGRARAQNTQPTETPADLLDRRLISRLNDVILALWRIEPDMPQPVCDLVRRGHAVAHVRLSALSALDLVRLIQAGYAVRIQGVGGASWVR